MGQNTSNNYKKNYNSTIFGYTISTPVYFKSIENEDDDNLLFKPFLYGLSTIPTSTSTLNLIDNYNSNSNSRADSGFLLCEKDSQLWKDLLYVDQTYYDGLKQQNKDEIEKNIILGDPLTFDDVLFMNQSNIQELYLSRRGFGSISPNIGLLSMIRKLDLSFNQIREIPEEIGHLHQLENLILSHNQITSIPDSICHLTQLIELNVSYNKIDQLTPFISHLKNLQVLHLEYNQLKELTVCIDNFINLNLLDLSNNPISILPAEITQLPFLRRLRLDGCPFVNSFDQQFQLAHSPPSLLETCARLIIKNEDQILQLIQKKQKQNTKKIMKKDQHTSISDTLKSYLTEPLYQYISSSKTCSFCHGPYFESYISRGRWIERNETWVPLEYRLCSAHWSDEEDRIYAMFSSSSSLASKKPNNSKIVKLKPELSPIYSKPTNNTSKTLLLNYFSSQLQRRSSITSPVTPTENESNGSTTMSTSSSSISILTTNVITNVPSNPVEEEISSSTFSTFKKWKFKVRNNSSSFLKKHRLYS